MHDKRDDRDRDGQNVAEAVGFIGRELCGIRASLEIICARLCVPQSPTTDNTAILERIETKVDQMAIKVSAVKEAVAEIRSANAEAFAELATRVTDLDAQIAALILQLADPEITDAVFEENLEAAKVSSAQLKDIVSGSGTTPPNT